MITYRFIYVCGRMQSLDVNGIEANYLPGAKIISHLERSLTSVGTSMCDGDCVGGSRLLSPSLGFIRVCYFGPNKRRVKICIPVNYECIDMPFQYDTSSKFIGIVSNITHVDR